MKDDMIHSVRFKYYKIPSSSYLPLWVLRSGSHLSQEKGCDPLSPSDTFPAYLVIFFMTSIDYVFIWDNRTTSYPL